MTAGTWRTIALGVLAIALAVVAGLLLGGGADEEEPSAAGEIEPHELTALKPKSDKLAGITEQEGDLALTSRPGHRLLLPENGNPFVWVRTGQKVDVHSKPGGSVVKTVGSETEFGSQRSFWVSRTEGEGWAGVPTPFTGNDGLGWIRLDERELKAGSTTLEIVVDLSDRRAELHRDGKVVRAFTVTIGAPGSTTPTGRFAVTDTFRGNLHPAYGCCAVALTAVQPNLPSGWNGGNRIAFHGTTGPLGQALSNGCVRAADRDVNALVNAVPPGTPVAISQ